MEETLDFIHGQHKTGKAEYGNRLVRETYKLHRGEHSNLVIGDTNLEESYVVRGVSFSSPVIGVASLGEMFSAFMRPARILTDENWRAYEPQVIDYVFKTFHGVDRLLVNHHSATLLFGKYVQGLTDENTRGLRDEFGRDGITTFHFLVSGKHAIWRRLRLQEENGEQRYPIGIARDLQEKYKHSRRMYRIIPGSKRFKHILSIFPLTWEMHLEMNPDTPPEDPHFPYFFMSPDFAEVYFGDLNPLGALADQAPKKYVYEKLTQK